MTPIVRTLMVAALLVIPGRAWAQLQPSNGLPQCGGRPAAHYVVVFDASSSLRKDEESRTHTVREYTRVLRLLSGLLCASDSLSVYTFAPDGVHRMAPLYVLTAANRSAGTLRRVSNLAIDTHTGHTDLHLSLQSIRADIFPDRSILAVFLVTDGSFFPQTPVPEDRTADGLRDRLDALASLADSLQTLEFIRSGSRDPAPSLYTIGVRSDNAWAIDRELDPAFSDIQSTRLWRRGTKSVDLRDHKGTDLLTAVFEDRFTRLEDISLWRILLATPDGLWSRRFGYSSGWGFPIERLQHLSARHLLFLPPAESIECPAPLNSGGNGRTAYASMEGSLEGRPVCSLERPSHEQVADLGRQGVKEFALLQGGTHEPVGQFSSMQGLHQFVLADSGKTCEIATVAAQFDHGEPWPPRDAHPVAQIWTVPLSTAEEPQNQPEEMNLIRLPRSHCLVPGFTGNQWQREKGEYAIFVSQSGGTTVYGVKFEPPPIRVIEQFVRPAGFPLPANELALVRVCVRRNSKLATDEQMWMWLQGKSLPLTSERARARCKGRSDEDGYMYGFSGLTLLDGSDIASARIFIGRSGDGLPPTDADVWVPLQLSVDGKLFLSWRGLTIVFLIGFGLQFAYLWFGTEAGRREGMFILFRLSTIASGTLSGILVCVAAEFWKMVREADISADKVPVIFAISILAHMMKILAAALIPEHVEECLFD
jgi:hypothetical protein